MSPFRRMFHWTPLEAATVAFISASHVFAVWLGGAWGYLAGALLWPVLMCYLHLFNQNQGAVVPGASPLPADYKPPAHPLPSQFDSPQMCRAVAVYPKLRVQRVIGVAVWTAKDSDAEFVAWVNGLEQADAANRRACGDDAECFYITELEPAV